MHRAVWFRRAAALLSTLGTSLSLAAVVNNSASSATHPQST
jgi:hypothetical protein